MLADSFRLATSRLVPPLIGCKRALVLAVVILAGCGGSVQAKPQLVSGPGYRFQAPEGWAVKHNRTGVTAAQDSELVQVSAFPLLRAYRPALFDRVAVEL